MNSDVTMWKESIETYGIRRCICRTWKCIYIYMCVCVCVYNIYICHRALEVLNRVRERSNRSGKRERHTGYSGPDIVHLGLTSEREIPVVHRQGASSTDEPAGIVHRSV